MGVQEIVVLYLLEGVWVAELRGASTKMLKMVRVRSIKFRRDKVEEGGEWVRMIKGKGSMKVFFCERLSFIEERMGSLRVLKGRTEEPRGWGRWRIYQRKPSVNWIDEGRMEWGGKKGEMEEG